MARFVSLSTAVDLLKSGGIVAVPSETVYGLCGNAFNARAVHAIFKAKQRPPVNPLIAHYASYDMVAKDVVLTSRAAQLMKRFSPGPLTLVLEKLPQSCLADNMSSGLRTAAVRIPEHPVFRKLLGMCDFPLAAPSANKAGTLSPTKAEHVWKTLPDIPIVEGAPPFLGVESTIVDVREEKKPVLLRSGSLTADVIEEFLGLSLLHPPSTKDKKTIFYSPGLLPRHYSPTKSLRLNAQSVLKEEGLLAFGPTPLQGAGVTLNLSCSGNLVEAAQHFFAFLHKLDQAPCEGIAVMTIPQEGLGVALNDRLKRAVTP